MQVSDIQSSTQLHSWICPDLRLYWHVVRSVQKDQVILQAKQGDRQFHFSLIEGFALQHFVGEFTIHQVQQQCQKKFVKVPSNLVILLVHQLVKNSILAFDSITPESPSEKGSPQFKSCIQWIQHPGGYWILRNPEDVTFLQVSDRDYTLLSQLGKLPLAQLLSKCDRTQADLQYLLRLLNATAMLEGTTPPKPPRRKFTPLQLLSFKFRLCNPDRWLSQHVQKLRWIWTQPFGIGLGSFLVWSALVAGTQSQAILMTGQQLWATGETSLLLAFCLLMAFVVSIHELGHAFTLKHYGGIVPEIGLMFMCLMPGCYTNTTDAYCLTKRRQRVLVVAAGVLCQLSIWAIAFWVWNLSNPGTWVHTSSYLLMVAALFTVAINLNPLSKFDGYYLASALTGINNLRSRSFLFYQQLLQLRPSLESASTCWLLAGYAPFSLGYTLLVFGHLCFWLIEGLLIHAPAITVSLLLLWLLYFVAPTSTCKVRSQ